MNYIYRVDTKTAHAWQVRLLQDRISKVFSDSHYGGKAGALRAAKKYLKESVKALPAADRKKIEFQQKHGRVYGKGFTKQAYGYYAFYWIPGKGIRQKYFSFRKYGKREARRLAIQFRKEGLARVDRTRKQFLP
jgi:hypothetical protein